MKTRPSVFKRQVAALPGRGNFANRIPWYLAACVMLLGSRAMAVTELEWDANTEPGVTGYKLYIGTASGVYTRSQDAGNNTVAPVPNLVGGLTYYFSVTAYNSEGLESPPSNEVSFTVPVPAPLQLTQLPAGGNPPPPGTVECTPAPGPVTGGFALTVTTAGQTAVAVYASQDLRTWETLGSVMNSTGRMTIRDLNSVGRPKRYYRMAVVPNP